MLLIAEAVPVDLEQPNLNGIDLLGKTSELQQ